MVFISLRAPSAVTTAREVLARARGNTTARLYRYSADSDMTKTVASQPSSGCCWIEASILLAVTCETPAPIAILLINSVLFIFHYSLFTHLEAVWQKRILFGSLLTNCDKSMYQCSENALSLRLSGRFKDHTQNPLCLLPPLSGCHCTYFVYCM